MKSSNLKYFICVFVSFFIASLGFAGYVLNDEVIIRMIWGITWSLIGIGWLCCLLSGYCIKRMISRDK